MRSDASSPASNVDDAALPEFPPRHPPLRRGAPPPHPARVHILDRSRPHPPDIREHHGMDLVGTVQAAGGFARTRDLLAAGATERMLTAAVRDGRLRRARNCWYSTLPEYDPRFRAVRVGGKLTGLSALRQLGAWTRGGTRVMSVSVPVNAARQRSPSAGRRRRRRRSDPVRLRWDPPEVARSGDAASVDPLHALVRVVLDEPFDEAVVALDWAWRAGLLDEPSFAWLI